MVLTNSGEVKFSDIKTEFGGATTIQLSQYYSGGSYITIGGSGLKTGPPASGVIKVSDLRGRWKNVAPLRYPPAALTGNSTTLSGNTYGNGSYVTTASYSYPGTDAYKIFDYVEGIYNTGWSSVGSTSTLYNGTTGAYSGSTSTTVSSVSYAGEWVQFQFPVSVKLCQYGFVPRSDFSPQNYQSRMPNRYIIAGSTNGTTWTLIKDESKTYSNATVVLYDYYDVSSFYSYYRFIINSCGSSGTSRDGADIAELRAYFATT